MKSSQIIKTIIKIVTILPAIIEGAKAIIKRYKDLNKDLNETSGL